MLDSAAETKCREVSETRCVKITAAAKSPCCRKDGSGTAGSMVEIWIWNGCADDGTCLHVQYVLPWRCGRGLWSLVSVTCERLFSESLVLTSLRSFSSFLPSSFDSVLSIYL